MIPRWLWALLLVALTSPFWDMGHPLIEVDDARYAEVPREMAETGDWITPRLNYMDYVEKPPLWYWLAATSYKVFGVSEASARLPLALLSLLGLLGVAWLGSWLFSPRAGVSAAVMLASSGLYFFLSHYITLDMALAVFLLWSCAMILRALLHPQDSRWASPLAWVFAGLAFLSKGLVALIFPVGWAIALIILYPQLRKNARALLSPLGPALFAALVLPWFIVMERRHPGFLHFFFAEQHFQRFLTVKYNRTSPWYFFLLVLPAGLLPWTPAALAGAANVLRRWREQPAAISLLLWAVMVTAFFSMSQSKLATYILPALPQLCLLAAAALDEPAPRWAKNFSWGLAVLLLASAIAAPWLPEVVRAVEGETLKFGLFAVATLALTLLCYGRHRAWVAAMGMGGLLLGAISLFALRAESERISARSMSAAIMERCKPGDKIYAYGIYIHGVPFYTRSPVDRVLNWTGELHYAKRDPLNAGRFGDDDAIRALPLKGRRVFLTYRRRQDSRDVLSVTSPDKIKNRRVFGRWELAEF